MIKVIVIGVCVGIVLGALQVPTLWSFFLTIISGAVVIGMEST